VSQPVWWDFVMIVYDFTEGRFVNCLGRFDPRRGLGIFLFFIMFRPALGPTQPPIQWVSGALRVGVKQPGRETDHSPPYSAEAKNACSYTSTPQYAFMAWCSVKAQGQFTFTLLLPGKVNWDKRGLSERDLCHGIIQAREGEKNQGKPQ
jgi:hypothetical protein